MNRRDVLRSSAAGLAGVSLMGSATAAFAQNDTKPAKPVRLGVLGCAHIHIEQYARMIEANDQITTVAAWDASSKFLDPAIKMLGCDKAASAGALLDRDDIDGVMILSENVHHEKLAGAAAKAGKPIFVEKPLAPTPEAARNIAEVVKKAGVTFQIGYHMRSEGNMRFLQKVVQEGKLGDITTLRLRYGHAGSLIGWWDGDYAWMGDPKLVGRGALGDLGIHLIDVLLWFTQGDKMQALTAQVDNVTGQYDGLDEYGTAVFRFESGLIATTTASYVDQNDLHRLEISGTKGHAHITKGRLFLTCEPITGRPGERYWAEYDPSLAHPLELFAQAVAGADVPLTSVEEAARACEIVGEMYKAAEARKWLEV